MERDGRVCLRLAAAAAAEVAAGYCKRQPDRFLEGKLPTKKKERKNKLFKNLS